MHRSQIIVAGGLIALMVGAIAALNQNSVAIQPRSMLAALPQNAPPSTLVTPTPTPTPIEAPAPAAPAQNYQALQITTCSGRESSANFRAYPSLDPRAVVGAASYGETIYLTGRTIRGDGVLWYEAMKSGGQVGWIASCFVGSAQDVMIEE